MKIKNLKVCREATNYSQISQSMSIYYSLLNKEKTGFRELHVPVLCRDYFNDALVAAHTDRDTPNIYGFSLVDERMDLKNVLMSVYINNNEDGHECSSGYSVVSPEKTAMDNFIFNLKMLNNLEALMKIRKTKIYLTDKTLQDEKYKAIIVEGSKAWLTSPPLLSSYTFILRCMCYNIDEVGKEFPTTLKKFLNKIRYLYPGSQDANYIKYLNDIDLDFLCKNFKKIFKNNPLTGFDDKVLNNSEHFNDSVYEVSLNLIVNGIITKGIFSMYKLHNMGGILTLSQLINTIKEYFKLKSAPPLTQLYGVTFAKNYLDLACEKVGCTLKTMPNKFPNDLLNYEETLNSAQT